MGTRAPVRAKESNPLPEQASKRARIVRDSNANISAENPFGVAGPSSLLPPTPEGYLDVEPNGWDEEEAEPADLPELALEIYDDDTGLEAPNDGDDLELESALPDEELDGQDESEEAAGVPEDDDEEDVSGLSPLSLPPDLAKAY